MVCCGRIFVYILPRGLHAYYGTVTMAVSGTVVTPRLFAHLSGISDVADG